MSLLKAQNLYLFLSFHPYLLHTSIECAPVEELKPKGCSATLAATEARPIAPLACLAREPPL